MRITMTSYRVWRSKFGTLGTAISYSSGQQVHSSNCLVILSSSRLILASDFVKIPSTEPKTPFYVIVLNFIFDLLV